jgi:hypothetical protein
VTSACMTQAGSTHCAHCLFHQLFWCAAYYEQLYITLFCIVVHYVGMK